MKMASETIDKQVTSKLKNICVRFEGNNSKRWDGKEILLETSVLEDMYEPDQLMHSSHVTIPWKGKGGRVSNWNAVVVDLKQIGRLLKNVYTIDAIT